MKTAAFTLTEILIVLALVALVSAVSWPLIGNWAFGARASGARSELVQMIRLARERSLAQFKGSTYGIKLMPDSYVLFKGTAYASRDSSYDLAVSLSQGLGLSWQLTGSGQADEVVFSSTSGEPSRWGSITINSGDSQAVINLNQAGYIE
jgi:prepilin-type N-terminal cleavage/methylation domain-containing protein